MSRVFRIIYFIALSLTMFAAPALAQEAVVLVEAAPRAVGAVAVVLILGLGNMLRGGSPNRSQKLMRLRVVLQFVAIIIIMATIWAMGK